MELGLARAIESTSINQNNQAPEGAKGEGSNLRSFYAAPRYEAQADGRQQFEKSSSHCAVMFFSAEFSAP